MPFTAEQVEYVSDYTRAPDPGRDVHWFRVELAPDRHGWAYASGSTAMPSATEVAERLTVLEPRLGKALEGAMRGGGIDLGPFDSA